MSKPNKRLAAQELRRAGMSMRAISSELNVSKGSVSLWCKDIVLSREQAEFLRARAIVAGAPGRLIGAKRNREVKERKVKDYTSLGMKTASRLSPREALLIGTAIYWGEGSKVGQLSFINSDKEMVLFMYRWFRDILGVAEVDFMPRIYINKTHKSRKRLIERYWSQLLEIDLAQFRSTVFIDRNSRKRYPNHEEYFGLLSLRVRKSTDLKYRILGLIQGLKYSTFR